MKKKFNNKLLFLLLLLIPLIAITIYITYAFYVGEVEGNESVSTIAVQGGNIIINYQGDSENIVASKIMPGWEATKTFTVSCSINYLDKSSVKIVWYDMILVVEQNTFENNSIEYSLQISDADKTKEGIFTEEEYHGIPKGASNITMASGYLLNEVTTHTYNLKLRYIDSDEIEQTLEANSKFNARVNIAGSKQTTLTIDFNGGEFNGTFALSKGPTYKIAANSRVYIPSSHINYYNLGEFAYFEKVSGEGSTSGNVVNTASESISVKAIYVDYPFNADSWSVIADNVKNNNSSIYEVGHAKLVKIDINGDGTDEMYKVRVANNSHYYSGTESANECKDNDGNVLTSQTACGFVVEFVDIVEKRAMNSTNTNVGGWPASSMYKYINGDTNDHLTYNDSDNGTTATLYSKLPSDLQSIIIDTTAISGHGSTSGETNFTSTDKLYLLSTKEVWVDGTSIIVSNRDTAYSTTRQLDYYSTYVNEDGTQGVTTSNYSGAKKNYNGTAYYWWLRTATSNSSNNFWGVYSNDSWSFNNANYSYGLAPAFRIG